jgi:hypothetical protein
MSDVPDDVASWVEARGGSRRKSEVRPAAKDDGRAITRGEPDVNGTGKPLVSVGQVLRIPEAHYLYGTGLLVLRVTEVDPDLGRVRGLEWVRIRGVEIRWDGKDGEAREVMVRVAALARQPGGRG